MKFKQVKTWIIENPFKAFLFLVLIILSLFLKIHEISAGAGDEFPGSDAWGYNNNAAEFLNGDKPISSYFNPLETLYLIPVYSIFGQSLFMAKFIQILLSFLIPFFLYYVTKKYFGESAGYIAASLALIHPFIIYYSAHLWAEFWIIFFLSLLLFLFVKELEHNKIRVWKLMLIGVVGAIGALAKIWFLPLAFLICFFILLPKFKKNSKFFIDCMKSVGLILVGILIVIVPWSIYASQTTGYFVFINTNSKTNLFIGNNPEGEIAYTSKPYNFDYTHNINLKEGNCGELLNQTKGIQNDFYFKKCAGKYTVNYIITNPGKFTSKMIQFTFKFWAFPNLEYFQRYIRSPSLLKVALWILWSFALIGLLISLQKYKDFLIFYLTILGIWFVHGISFYLARYKAGLAPIVIIFAAGGIYTLWLFLFSKNKN
ncbi:MAG: glycosyltransferase family 39 protein [Candidatus Woesearchaeota archaeon]|jgi:4-amino-4-deoxy-L-arabinose transferase-like glycosyltransferase